MNITLRAGERLNLKRRRHSIGSEGDARGPAPNTSPRRPPQTFFRSATSASSIARALRAAGRWLIRA
jgi:hypothetical protein